MAHGSVYNLSTLWQILFSKHYLSIDFSIKPQRKNLDFKSLHGVSPSQHTLWCKNMTGKYMYMEWKTENKLWYTRACHGLLLLNKKEWNKWDCQNLYDRTFSWITVSQWHTWEKTKYSVLWITMPLPWESANILEQTLPSLSRNTSTRIRDSLGKGMYYVVQQ
jgi:hypothetical protein